MWLSFKIYKGCHQWYLYEKIIFLWWKTKRSSTWIFEYHSFNFHWWCSVLRKNHSDSVNHQPDLLIIYHKFICTDNHDKYTISYNVKGEIFKYVDLSIVDILWFIQLCCKPSNLKGYKYNRWNETFAGIWF